MTHLQHITELLERFMEGETTLEEERTLGDWLRTHEVDDTLKPYQRMFAAFDDGFPLAAPRHRRRVVWWHWAAAAAIACVLAVGGWRLVQQPPGINPGDIVAKEQPIEATPTDTIAPTIITSKPQLALAASEVPAHKAKPAKTKKNKTARPQQFSAKDSIEVIRTEAELELAESEFLAEQIELEQQLQQLRQLRSQQQNGWHYTALPCQ